MHANALNMRVTQVPLLHHAAGASRADAVLIMNRDDLNGQQSIYSLNVFQFRGTVSAQSRPLYFITSYTEDGNKKKEKKRKTMAFIFK